MYPIKLYKLVIPLITKEENTYYKANFQCKAIFVGFLYFISRAYYSIVLTKFMHVTIIGKATFVKVVDVLVIK